MCVVLFRRQNINIYASVVETLLGYVTDIKIANAPFYVIDGAGDLSKIPHVKLFLLICDCNNDYTNGNSKDLRLSTIRVMHRLGGKAALYAWRLISDLTNLFNKTVQMQMTRVKNLTAGIVFYQKEAVGYISVFGQEIVASVLEVRK